MQESWVSLRALQQLHRLRAGQRVLEPRHGQPHAGQPAPTAWTRCYAPKPARAVEYCARLAPRSTRSSISAPPTATCIPRSRRGTAWTTTRACRGPAPSRRSSMPTAKSCCCRRGLGRPGLLRGQHHWYYSGLTDGNYAQDQRYDRRTTPGWWTSTSAGCTSCAATLAWAIPDVLRQRYPRDGGRSLDGPLPGGHRGLRHPGFLANEGGLPNALRSYYMLQQLTVAYASPASPTSATPTPRGSCWTLPPRWLAGLPAITNRHAIQRRHDDRRQRQQTERMKVQAYGRDLDLPPNGYAGWTEDGQIEVLSSDPRGHRCDYAATPAYLFIDGRGQFVRFPKAAGNDIGICRMLPDGQQKSCSTTTPSAALPSRLRRRWLWTKKAKKWVRPHCALRAD